MGWVDDVVGVNRARDAPSDELERVERFDGPPVVARFAVRRVVAPSDVPQVVARFGERWDVAPSDARSDAGLSDGPPAVAPYAAPPVAG